MSVPQVTLIDNVKVGTIGYGLMGLTLRTQLVSDEQAFAAILASLERGSTFLNAGEFYGFPPHTFANLKLLARFFDKYPEWAEPGKLFLSVKGGFRIEDGVRKEEDGSEEGLRRSVDNINALLGGKKKMDLFEMARVDRTRPIEDVIRTLKTLIDEGKFRYIGISEVSAETMRRAHKVHPIAGAEVEYSMFSLDIEKNGVLSTAKELGIPVIAYSPLGRGLLTGTIKKASDIPEGDYRRNFDRFQAGEALDTNLKLVEKVEALAAKKGVTTTQIAIAWLLEQGVIPIPGSSRPEGVVEALGSAHIQLTEAELRDIRHIIDTADVRGGRYAAPFEAALEG